MKNPKGCWRMLAGAVLLQFAVVGLSVNGFSVYLPYLLERCGLTNAESASVVLVRSMFAFLTLFVVGKLYDRLELRLGITLAVSAAAASMCLYSVASVFWQLAAAAAVSGIAYGLGGMYAVSLLIHRWFRVHEPLALGICTATTGLATVVGAPVITALVEFGSVERALRIEAAFLLLCALGCFCLIRNWPSDAPRVVRERRTGRRKFRLTWMHVAAVAVGAPGNTAFQFLAMHFTTQGFAPFRVSALVSAAGFGLMASKFLFGETVDRWGAYRSNWLFFSAAIAGLVLCCIPGSFAMAMGAVILFTLGLAFSTVGLTVYAEDLAAPEEFSDTLREYQICYLFGVVLSSYVPGALADWTGSYVPFYLLTSLLAAFALLIIQRSYQRKRAGAAK